MTTFHEMLNRVAFKTIAGRVGSESDLWALRDLLVERLFSAQDDISRVWETYRMNMDTPVDMSMINTFAVLTERLEQDIMLIEQYLSQRKIPRP